MGVQRREGLRGSRSERDMNDCDADMHFRFCTPYSSDNQVYKGAEAHFLLGGGRHLTEVFSTAGDIFSCRLTAGSLLQPIS